MSRRRKVFPVPEMLELTGIDIRSGDGSMDNDARIMRVPLIDTPSARHIRAHELAHARYSPKRPMAPRGIDMKAIQRAEDMRMNVYARKQGLHEAMDAPTVTDQLLLAEVVAESELSAVTAMAATYNTGDYDGVVTAARALYPEKVADFEKLVSALWDKMDSPDEPSWGDTVRTARALMTGDPEEGEGEGEGEGGGEGEGEGEGADGEMVPVSTAPDALDTAADRELYDAADKLEHDTEADPFDAGRKVLEEYVDRYRDRSYVSDAAYLYPPLKVTELKLRQRMAPNKFKTRSKVPAEMGRVPRYMNRYCSDQAVFAGRGKRRDRGGVVLIDCSGSMSLDDHDVDAIMEAAPAGTIATYNGAGQTAELYVVARNGKRAPSTERLRPPHYGNVADVQSLQWMVRRPGPYFWVCDGVVTGGSPAGHSETPHEDVGKRCLEMMDKHHILMVPDVRALIEAMSRTR